MDQLFYCADCLATNCLATNTHGCPRTHGRCFVEKNDDGTGCGRGASAAAAPFAAARTASASALAMAAMAVKEAEPAVVNKI